VLYLRGGRVRDRRPPKQSDPPHVATNGLVVRRLAGKQNTQHKQSETSTCENRTRHCTCWVRTWFLDRFPLGKPRVRNGQSNPTGGNTQSTGGAPMCKPVQPVAQNRITITTWDYLSRRGGLRHTKKHSLSTMNAVPLRKSNGKTL